MLAIGKPGCVKTKDNSQRHEQPGPVAAQFRHQGNRDAPAKKQGAKFPRQRQGGAHRAAGQMGLVDIKQGAAQMVCHRTKWQRRRPKPEQQ